MKANETQVGGTHYKTQYEHWDLAVFVPLGYLEGCATKYVARHRKKGGLQDLQKAMHYLDKLIECWDVIDLIRTSAPDTLHDHITKFSEANDLSPKEHEFVYILCTYDTIHDLYKAYDILMEMIQNTEQSRAIPEPTHPGTPDDGGHHSKENSC